MLSERVNSMDKLFSGWEPDGRQVGWSVRMASLWREDVRTSSAGCWLVCFCEHSVQRREHDQRQQGRADKSADDDHGERTLNFRSDAVRKRQRNQTQHRDQSRHQHGAQAKQAAAHDRLVIREAFIAKLD